MDRDIIPYQLEISIDRVTSLRRGGLLAKARALEAQLEPADSTTTAILFEGSSMYAAGVELAHFDRELRRAAAIVKTKGRLREFPRPLNLRHNTSRILEADSGSLDLIVEPLGAVAAILLSNPVQLLLTVDALISGGRRLHVWLHPNEDPLRGITAREALEVLKAFRAIDTPLGEPTAVLEPTRKRAQDHGGMAKTRPYVPERYEAELTRQSLELPDGTVARARRIVHVRRRKNGKADYFLLE
jgi:hypothetical protein